MRIAILAMFCWCWCPGPGFVDAGAQARVWLRYWRLLAFTFIALYTRWLALSGWFSVLYSEFTFSQGLVTIFFFMPVWLWLMRGKKQTNKQINKQQNNNKKGAIQSVARQWHLLASFPNLVNPRSVYLVVLNYLVDYTLTAWTSKRSGKPRTLRYFRIPVCVTLHWLQYSVHNLHIHDARVVCGKRVVQAL